MKKTVSVLLLLLIVLPLALLSGCQSKPVLRVYNWAEYIDEGVIDQFEEEFNCTVKYSTFDSNEAMLSTYTEAKVSQDVLFPSDYTIGKMVHDGLLEELDYSRLPNAVNIDDRFFNTVFDPNNEYRKYSVPYMWGTLGILYDTTKVTEPVDNWSILFDTKYKGNVIMMDSERDTMAVALKKLGYSLNTTDLDQIAEAKALLLKQKKDGIVVGYRGDEAKPMMINKEAALAVVYSGVAYLAIDESDDLAYAVPKEGTNVWVDNAVIPKNAKNKDLAYKFIDFLCRPEVAKANVEYILYSTPNKAAYELLDEETRSNEVLYPSDEFLISSGCEAFVRLPLEVEKAYKNAFNEVTSN